MKHIRIVGLCLIAVFALSVAATSSASAASPEFKTCIKAIEKTPEKTYTDGEYSDKACGTPSPGGKYKLANWNEGKEKFKLKGKGGAGVNFQYIPSTQTVIGATECTSEKQTGLVTGSKEAEFTTEYKGCKTNEGKSCESAGAGKGKIKTESLTATLIAQPGSTDGVGIQITPKTGTTLAKYECEGLSVTASGSVIGEVIGGTAAATGTTTYTFAKGPGAFQKFGYFGQNVEENFASFKAWGEGKGPAPNAVILSTIEGPEVPGGKLTLPATQQSSSLVKTEKFKIV